MQGIIKISYIKTFSQGGTSPTYLYFYKNISDFIFKVCLNVKIHYLKFENDGRYIFYTYTSEFFDFSAVIKIASCAKDYSGVRTSKKARRKKDEE